MFDCKSQHKRCNACCCGVVPLSNERWERNQHKIVMTPIKILPAEGPCHVIENGTEVEIEGDIYPITESGKCTFLNKDLSCNIYDDRPHICKKFGDESTVHMTCSYQDKDGRVRSRQEKRMVERDQKKKTESMIKKFQIFARE